MQHNIALALAFVARFPVGDDPDKPTMVRIKDYDDFCFEQHKQRGFTTPREQQSIWYMRNRLKRDVNRAAKSKAWRDAGHVSFRIEVVTPDALYRVVRAEVAFRHVATAVPKEVNNLIRKREAELHEYCEAVDQSTLDEATKTYIEVVQLQVSDARRTIISVIEGVDRILTITGQRLDARRLK